MNFQNLIEGNLLINMGQKKQALERQSVNPNLGHKLSATLGENELQMNTANFFNQNPNEK